MESLEIFDPVAGHAISLAEALDTVEIDLNDVAYRRVKTQVSGDTRSFQLTFDPTLIAQSSAKVTLQFLLLHEGHPRIVGLSLTAFSSDAGVRRILTRNVSLWRRLPTGGLMPDPSTLVEDLRETSDFDIDVRWEQNTLSATLIRCHK